VQSVIDGRVRARARELYALALVDPDWTPDEVCARTGWAPGELAAALDALAELGLAAPFASVSSGWSVRSPATAMAELIDNSRRQSEELLNSVNRAHTSLSDLVSEFQPIHIRQLAEARIEVAAQQAQIAAILDEATRTCTTELLSIHPGRPLPAARLATGDERNRVLLRRGVAMRSIHLTSSAAVPYARAHLKDLVSEGAEVRTATTLPMRMIIVDNTLAIVPIIDPDSDPDGEAHADAPGPAMVLRSPVMVGVLRQMFEHVWETSSDLFTDDSFGPAPVARHREVVRLLASGLTDEAIARKLGLSDRTVRRIVAELMQQIGAESRFQAGVKMVRLGWLDDAPGPFDDVVGNTQAGQVGSSLSVSAASSTGRAADS
jgi:DNA-binding CsgD family transcriptional regulator